MLQLQETSPPDPLWYNIFPSISRRPSFSVKGYKCYLFNIWVFKKCLSFRGQVPWPPLLKGISRSLLEIPFQNKRLQMSSFEHPKFTWNASASGGYDIFPDICLETPFQGKRLVMSSFEHPNLQNNASASGAKPPDPLWCNRFPDICWRLPFRVKG